MARTHGISATYSAGCRCQPCTTAHSSERADIAARQARQLVEGKPVTHGSYSTYVNYKCRCEPCTTANRVACAGYRARRRTKPGA